MSEMRVYVGTYEKYNNGSIAGAWLDLEDYADKEEFYEACKALHEDEEDPELMFQDWEGIPKSMISECSIDDAVWELMGAYEDHGKGPVDAYCSIFGEWNESDFGDRYRGEWSSDEAMAEEFLEETGTLGSIPENLRCYFDVERYARDMMCDMCEEDGFYFWNH